MSKEQAAHPAIRTPIARPLVGSAPPPGAWRARQGKSAAKDTIKEADREPQIRRRIETAGRLGETVLHLESEHDPAEARLEGQRRMHRSGGSRIG